MILVTGATGLVGGHLLWHLLQHNDKIVAIRRNSSKLEPLRTIFKFYTSHPDAFLDRIEWRVADLHNEASLREAMQGIQTLYHCAAVVSLGSTDPQQMDVNVSGTRTIVKLCLEMPINTLCFVSSIAACGVPEPGQLIDEFTPWSDVAGKSLYAQSKYASEQEVWKGIAQGLKAVIVNPGVILGVSGTSTGSSQLFLRVRKGLPFYVSGGSGYVDVQDVVQAMIQLTMAGITGERFILVGENNTNQEILSWIADGFNKPRPRIRISGGLLLAGGYLMQWLGSLFGFTPLLDAKSARSATKRAFYTSEKVKNALHMEFRPTETCIGEVCRFMLQE